MSTGVHGVQGSWAPAPMELELQLVVSFPMWVLGTKLKYFERTAHILNWTISLALKLCVLGDMKNGVRVHVSHHTDTTKPSSEGFAGPQQRKEKGPGLFCKVHTKPGISQEVAYSGPLGNPENILEPQLGPMDQSSGLFLFGYSHGHQASEYPTPSTTSGASKLLKAQRTDGSGFVSHRLNCSRCCHCDAKTATGTVTCERGLLQCGVYVHKNRKQVDLAHQTGWHTPPMDHNFLTDRSVFLSLCCPALTW